MSSSIPYEPPTIALSPFLKIDMESRAQEISATNDLHENSRQRWTPLLLNLAFVLLQLGILQPIEEYPHRKNSDRYRDYIIRRIDRNDLEKPDFTEYLTVVRDCADFKVNLEGDGAGKAFREEYYRRIILPFKELEQSLESIFR